ncbi:hypothetical protein ARMGADRAFT_281742 [Armillaria gallica]|uniref:Uncharacterized protein n=1 Tax=Armillaria gallica TaxID=47427 RepID=A0A2H3D6L0_ARMGA|nr:hypothetical protein ARMGADRAFT_281742 [Armillaria gallica]
MADQDTRLQYPAEVLEEADSSSPAPSSDTPRPDRSVAPHSHGKRRHRSLPRQRHHRAVPPSHSEIDLLHGFGGSRNTDNLRRDVQILDAFERRFAALRTQLVEATASLSAHKVQLQNAKMELQRAEDIIADVDRQRIEAEVQSAKDRATARRLLMERAMDEAKEQGYKEGYQEGFGMARSFREIRTRRHSARDRGVPVPVFPPTRGRTAKSNLSVSIMADYEDLEEKLKVPVYPNPMVAVMRSVASSFANPPDWQSNRRGTPDRRQDELHVPSSPEPVLSPSHDSEEHSTGPSSLHSEASLPLRRLPVSPEVICPIPTQIYAPSPVSPSHSHSPSDHGGQQSLEQIEESTTPMDGPFRALTRYSKFSPHIDDRGGDSRASTPLSQYAMLRPPASEPDKFPGRKQTERIADEWRSQNHDIVSSPANRGQDTPSRPTDWEFVSPISEASYHASSLYNQTDPESQHALGEGEQSPRQSPPKRLRSPLAWLRKRFQRSYSSPAGVNIQVEPPSQSPSNPSEHTTFNPRLLTDRPLPDLPPSRRVPRSPDPIELPDDRLPPGFVPIPQIDERFSPIPQVPTELAPMRRPVTAGGSMRDNASLRSRAPSFGGHTASLHRPISLFSDS